jgi:hypothetical protein
MMKIVAAEQGPATPTKLSTNEINELNKTNEGHVAPPPCHARDGRPVCPGEVPVQVDARGDSEGAACRVDAGNPTNFGAHEKARLRRALPFSDPEAAR